MEDFSKVAITNTILTLYFKSPLSTVSHQVKDIGIKTFEISFEQMNSSIVLIAKTS